MLSTTEPVAQVTGQSSAMNSSSHLEAKSTPSSSAQPAQRGSAEPKGRPGTVASCAWMAYPLGSGSFLNSQDTLPSRGRGT